MTNNKGMTLIEVMIVVVILAGMAVIGISRFNKTNNDIKATIRKISVLSKELHNSARMNNKTYRIVFQMEDEKSHTIWVESAPKAVLLTEDSFTSEIPKDKEEEKKKDEKPGQDTSSFSPDPILKRPIVIPRPLIIRELEIAGMKAPATSGRAFLYYLPAGLTQEAAIHLSDKKDLNWTIVIHPITGEARILSEDRPLKELRVE